MKHEGLELLGFDCVCRLSTGVLSIRSTGTPPITSTGPVTGCLSFAENMILLIVLPASCVYSKASLFDMRALSRSCLAAYVYLGGAALI